MTTATDALPIGAPNSTTGAPTTRADRAVAMAQDVPDLIAKATIIAPELAAQITPKALVASKSVWGNLATMAVTWIATKYGFGWNDQTDALVSGLAVMAATVVLRKVSVSPIGGWFSAKGTTP